ncbi:Small ubiquitin-related modifier 1 [Striga hermonthica]|uniref:Small ubiquitin-related modifier 1 n=1 Tax=Striga hermonthica TaxID=68872 RepID=A0A9N7NQQ8_STRHE|nr:Small ubiquitin-related modifier 1 [Striga hermonthica]
MPIANGDVTSEGDSHASLNLKVASPDDGDVYFRIKNTTKLKKLMQAYCDRQSLDRNSVVFTFNGRRLGGDQTSQQVL